MRYLGIDYGRRRIGLAVSDAGARIAFPHGTIHHAGNVFVLDQILSVVKRERDMCGIVVGLPLGMEGQETEESQYVREFARELASKTDLPIEFENEMFSSRIVENAGVAKEHVDESSAAVILQSYLDNKNRVKG